MKKAITSLVLVLVIAYGVAATKDWLVNRKAGKIGDPKTNHLRLVLPGNTNGQIPSWRTSDSKYHPSTGPSVNPTDYGCHGDYKATSGVVATNGSATITDALNPWTAADVGKVIRIESTTLFKEVFAGTIAAFNNPGSIDVSSPVVVTNGNTFSAEWATSDDACLAAINTAMGSTANRTGLTVVFNKPVAMTTTWTLNGVSGDISATGGCATEGITPAPLVWFGTTPDIPMIARKGAMGLSIHNICEIGGSLYPPSYGVMDQQTIGVDNPNIMNKLSDSQIGGYFGIGGVDNLPHDNGGSQVAALNANTAINDTSLTITSSSANFPGPGPDQLILINDQSFGAVEGSEFAITAHNFTRITAPCAPCTINLARPLSNAHTAANTHVLIAFGTFNNGFGTDVTSTQDDTNKFDSIRVRDVNTCASFLTGQNGGTYLHGINCNQTLFGFVSTGATTYLDATEFEGVGVKYAISNTAHILSSSDNEQQGGGASYGPGFTLVDHGGVIKYLQSGWGFPTLTEFTCDNCSVDLSASLNFNGDIIETGAGNSQSITFRDATLSNDANGSLADTTNPTIHSRGTLALRDVYFSYKPLSNHYLTVDDAGSSDNRAIRTYDITRLKHSAGEASDRWRLQLRGAETASDVHNRMDQEGWSNLTGTETIATLGTPANILLANCTGGNSGGATDYWYHYAYSVHGLYQKANVTGSKLTCTNAPSVPNPVSISVFPIKGADQLHLFQASCVSPCADPLNEVEVAVAPVNNQPSNSFVPNTIQDTGVSIGTAMPTFDTTGVFTAGGAILGSGSWQDKLFAVTPSAHIVPIELANGATFTSTVTTTGANTFVSNPTLFGSALASGDAGREFELVLNCSNGSNCDTLSFGSFYRVDASATMPTNGKKLSCHFRVVASNEVDQIGGCSAVLAAVAATPTPTQTPTATPTP